MRMSIAISAYTTLAIAWNITRCATERIICCALLRTPGITSPGFYIGWYGTDDYSMIQHYQNAACQINIVIFDSLACKPRIVYNAYCGTGPAWDSHMKFYCDTGRKGDSPCDTQLGWCLRNTKYLGEG